jgi:hypothetical protein
MRHALQRAPVRGGLAEEGTQLLTGIELEGLQMARIFSALRGTCKRTTAGWFELPSFFAALNHPQVSSPMPRRNETRLPSFYRICTSGDLPPVDSLSNRRVSAVAAAFRQAVRPNAPHSTAGNETTTHLRLYQQRRHRHCPARLLQCVVRHGPRLLTPYPPHDLLNEPRGNAIKR